MTVRDAPNPLVHRVEMNPGNEERKIKTKLDEVLSDKEERAARRYSVAELDVMALQSENEAARLRGEPPKHKYHGGDEMTDEEKEKKKLEEAEQREKLMASATALISSGLDPKQVGQMLLGLTPTPATGYPPTQGMTFDDVMKMVGVIVGKRESDKLEDIIASLEKKVDDLAKGGGATKVEAQRIPTPMEYAKQQVEYINALKELGLIKEPVATGPSGEPLEIVRERNRHEEKMEEVKSERDYKQSLSQTVANLPERIGHGIAGQFSEESGGGSSRGGNSGLKYITCTEEGCGARFPIPPNAGKELECPKCGAIYAQGATKEPEAK